MGFFCPECFLPGVKDVLYTEHASSIICLCLKLDYTWLWSKLGTLLGVWGRRLFETNWDLVRSMSGYECLTVWPKGREHIVKLEATCQLCNVKNATWKWCLWARCHSCCYRAESVTDWVKVIPQLEITNTSQQVFFSFFIREIQFPALLLLCFHNRPKCTCYTYITMNSVRSPEVIPLQPQ